MTAEKPTIIAEYDAVLAISQQMLAAAANNLWDDLVELEKKRAAVLAGIDSNAIAGSSDAALQQGLAGVIRQILDSDSQIKILTEAWVGELNGILRSLGTEKKLQQTYDTR